VVVDALNQLPSSLWQIAVTHLQRDGVAVLELLTTNNDTDTDTDSSSCPLQTVYHPRAFATARHAMDLLSKNNENKVKAKTH
jgi:hypothetical protein